MTRQKGKSIKRTFLLLLCSFITVINSFAQITNTGEQFFVSFGRNKCINSNAQLQSNPVPLELILRITAMERTSVSLHFRDSVSCDRTIVVEAGEILDYHLSKNQAIACYMYSSYYLYMNKSLEINATKPITVVAITTANASVEATQVYPVENLGTEYIIAGLPPFTGGSGDNNCTHNNGYLVVATEDGTMLDQYSSYMGSISTPLSKGQVYYFDQLSSLYDAKGVRVVSNKPVAVFQSSSQITAFEAPRNTTLFEQLAPVNQWGTKFIMPTNDLGGGFARIWAKDAGTNVKVTYSDGSENTFQINDSYLENRYRDIQIDKYHNGGSNSCYITTDKPVGVCTYHIQYDRYATVSGQVSQPGVAWLPPLEQRTRSVLTSPLDLNVKFIYLAMDHYLLVIAPTASVDHTTIVVDNGIPHLAKDISNFTWVAHNIGNSGYSFGRYYLGQSNVANNIHIGKHVLIDNPEGVIVLAYGQGGYANYFYSLGDGGRDLTASFNINGKSYIDVDGKAYCDDNNFTFEAILNTLTNITWKLNGQILSGPGNETIVHANNLPDGYYIAEMIVNNKTYAAHFFVGGASMIWTPENNRSLVDIEKQDWNIPNNWTPMGIPTSCHNVYIPGNSSHYPQLTSASKGVCNNIYFIQGGELGRPDLLTYQKAHVQMNFDLKQPSFMQEKDNNKNLVLKSSSITDRMQYSAALSADPIERERWHMLSSPLKGVVTGDLGFGGFPLTYLMKFDPVRKDNHSYSVGNWTIPYTTMVEQVSEAVTDGFAFFMYGWVNSSGNNNGCYESGEFDDPGFNDLSYLPDIRSGESYGLKQTNGILELPFFDDSISLYAHRTQVYDPLSDESTFYYIFADDQPEVNALTGDSEILPREADNGNYRFAPEEYDGSEWTFINPVHHPVTDFGDGYEFLVGNPYMSSIDPVEFCLDNSESVYSEFRIWNGEAFDSYSVDTDEGTVTPTAPGSSPYISPLQGFFLTYKGEGDVVFDVTKISTVRPPKSPFNLRSASEIKEENILRIKAENNVSVSHALIGYKKGASNDFVRGEDVQKLFSPYSHVPEVYSLAGEIPADINFISNSGEVVVPLGIKTEQKGEVRFTFSGMNNYSAASRIEFFDALENRTIDLTGIESYTYTFNSEETGIQNGRFSFRIGNSTTGLTNSVSSENLNVYCDSKGIYIVSSASDPVQQITVYDLQGRKLYEKLSNERYYPLQENLARHASLVVKVKTKNQVKTVKLNAVK